MVTSPLRNQPLSFGDSPRQQVPILTQRPSSLSSSLESWLVQERPQIESAFVFTRMVCRQRKAPPLQRENYIPRRYQNTWVLSVFGTTYADLKVSQIGGSTLSTRHAITATTTLSTSADRISSIPMLNLSPWTVDWFPSWPYLILLTETTYVTELSALEDRLSVSAHSILVLFGHFDIVLDINGLCLAFNSSSLGWTEDSFEVGVLHSFPLASLERLLPSRFARDLLELSPTMDDLALVEPKVQLELFSWIQSLEPEIAYGLSPQLNVGIRRQKESKIKLRKSTNRICTY
ncbi:hypothetical protein M9H77_23624 [Catharanthus roseus]|uniref:Uncharacterized protein n=1 Tax=Catharanthus roseus TaxID=4058 RepID=A0ACC0AU98_CATRO|nr:hypothetical protein M9H77_23624 [Catharanthus roseus]